MKCEGNRKFLVLRPCYTPAAAATTVPPPAAADDTLNSSNVSLMSPGSRQAFSLPSEQDDVSVTSFSAIDNSVGSPFRGDPPPYKPPPEVQKLRAIETETKEQYRECVDEFRSALSAFDKRNNVGGEQVNGEVIVEGTTPPAPPPVIPPRKRNSSAASADASLVAAATIVAAASRMDVAVTADKENAENVPPPQNEVVATSRTNTLEKQISVKEATKKFNLIASEEEANKLITSPPAKKKPEKVSDGVLLFF